MKDATRDKLLLAMANLLIELADNEHDRSTFLLEARDDLFDAMQEAHLDSSLKELP